MSQGWQKTPCGPVDGATASLPSCLLAWCRGGHTVILAGIRSHIPQLLPALVAQKLGKALPGRVRSPERSWRWWGWAGGGILAGSEVGTLLCRSGDN